MRRLKSLLPLLAIILLSLGIVSCQSQSTKLHGYVEANMTNVASPFAGRLLTLAVQRGASVHVGDSLFTLEPMPEQSDVKAAEKRLLQAQAQLADLQKGRRPTEIDAIVAQIDETKANIDFLQKQLSRRTELVKKSALQKESLDRAVLQLSQSNERLKQLQANLATARLGARNDLISAAEHRVEIEQALLQKARWAIEEKVITATKDALVFDTFYRSGELVPANFPVVSLLSNDDLKVVFFIPEAQLSQVHLNQSISIECDQCPEGFRAHIQFISPVAEFTPPIIYSNSARSKLVFRVEAKPDHQTVEKLHPGQPVDITLFES